ncbi:zinc-dependent alcohol dehydrogenase family protein [Brevibacillus sp. LEMMJ03]|uniref:zinc-dependent alcohol dehydrogenase family protein n=1 Tax=Brevibacillus sp. LEMMJ03 TaxID=2595056 RepID=UPI00117CAC9D|nr:zinc-dependent alcohol dehydrogenase family protein [Brevibacillus sp. LEMMJ03]TRY24469.1 zinc-dependent alcohol dehydrogenase family protein [Brevibacillus sp. LEMMJ03]
MKALIFRGPGKYEWVEKDKPTIQKPTDAIVRITKTTICGTDLHILGGDVPAVTDGRTLGHEGVGIVEEVGPGVNNFKPGDRVLISCVTSCGRCDYCKKAMYAHCEDGGWILGHLIDGTQAEYVRIPYADTSMYHIPPGSDEEALVMLSDILPTAMEIGVINSGVQPGDVVAIVGAGPVGMSALMTAQLYSPAEIIMVDLDDNRLEQSKKFGATKTVNSSKGNAVEQVMEVTDGKGVDVAIEAVGFPVTFDICQQILKPGGRLANVGVHGKPVDLHLERLWLRNVRITTGLVSTSTTPMLLKTVQSGKIKPEHLITHRFPLDQIMQAYEVFKSAGLSMILCKLQ